MALDDTSNSTVAKRQVSARAAADRDARLLVRPFNRNLGIWQASSVQLQVLAQRWPGPEAAEKVAAMLAEVTAEKARFEALVAEKDLMVARHTRVEDTLRSFTMVLDRLRGANAAMGR